MIEGIANVSDGAIEPRAGAMPEESAAQHVVSRIPVARRGDLVAAAIAALTGRAFDVIDTLYVVDDDNRLIGGVPLVDLFGAPGDRRVETLADAESARVGPRRRLRLRAYRCPFFFAWFELDAYFKMPVPLAQVARKRERWSLKVGDERHVDVTNFVRDD